MSGALPFLAIGFVLIVVVILLLRRPQASDDSLAGQSRDDGSPAALRPGPFPRESAARLFGSEDWDFILRQGSLRLKRLFLQQRKQLALSWLRSASANATKLIRAHRTAVRSNSHLEPLLELQVAADYLLFQMLCQMLALIIQLRGPVNLSRLIGCAESLSRRLYETNMSLFPAQLTREHNQRESYLPRGRRGG